MTTARALTTLCLAALAAGTAHAGRPLATDDAGTTPAGECLIETWIERGDGSTGGVFAPACGVADGVEVGLEASRTTPDGGVRFGAGAAMKWVPAAGTMATPWGEAQAGLKLGVGGDRLRSGGWGGTAVSALLLLSTSPLDGLTLHANLGPQRDRDSGLNATLLNLAAVWTLGDAGLVFAELQANDRRGLLGGTVRTSGLRWWLLPERLGVDLTASREAGVPGSTLWTLGLGWYGLGQ
jgi:hypothetical protein